MQEPPLTAGRLRVKINPSVHLGAVPVSTGVMQLVKLSVCDALNGKSKYKR